MAATTYAALEETAERQPYKAVNPNHPRLALKHGKLFLLMDTQGEMPGDRTLGYGLFADDTRWLNRWQLSLNGAPLLLLNHSVLDGFAGRFVLSNETLPEIPAQSLLVERKLVINRGLTECLTVTNFHSEPIDVELKIDFDNDFADMFEVRGANRQKRGSLMQPVVQPDNSSVALAYLGLDSILRETFVHFLSLYPSSLSGSRAIFRFTLARHEEKSIEISITQRQVDTRAHAHACSCGHQHDAEQHVPEAQPTKTYEVEREVAAQAYDAWRQSVAQVQTDNAAFNAVLERAYQDIYLLRQESDNGRAIAAGVPWFAVPFGRDSAITALQTVQFMPELAADVLRILALHQGREHDEETAQEPGKIMHELRVGEMARMKEIAFRPYYGTVDATQLWLMLLGQYVDATGDLALARQLWPNVEAAEAYLSRSLRRGYITYGGKPGAALSNQGWKDSGNSIVYSDGALARAPIALCEAQGYLYAAWRSVASVAAKMGKKAYAANLRNKAMRLAARFRRDFWMKDKQFVALALDGDLRQCDVVSSNPGHLLGLGILDSHQEPLVAKRLMESDMFCGWGIRTLSAKEVSYQPMDYQLGSVWPHDNGFAIEGLARTGHTSKAHAVMKALFDLALAHDDLRLPELVCGFEKGNDDKPVRYPVACVPQAWAAGSVFQLLKGCLSMQPDAAGSRLHLERSALPAWLGKVCVKNLRIGASVLTVEFTRQDDGSTAVSVAQQAGPAIRLLK